MRKQNPREFYQKPEIQVEELECGGKNPVLRGDFLKTGFNSKSVEQVVFARYFETVHSRVRGVDREGTHFLSVLCATVCRQSPREGKSAVFQTSQCGCFPGSEFVRAWVCRLQPGSSYCRDCLLQLRSEEKVVLKFRKKCFQVLCEGFIEDSWINTNKSQVVIQ